MNLTGCEIRSVLFGLHGRVEEWNLTTAYEVIIEKALRFKPKYAVKGDSLSENLAKQNL